MKFTANSIELQRTLNKVGGVVPSKSTMPILENILCELLGNMLTLTATDLAISLTVSLQVRGSEDGRIAIPAKRLMDTMKSLPDTSTTFSIDTGANKIKITTENGEYGLTGETAKDFPPVPPFKGTSEFSIDSNILRGLIHRTTFAVSTDELRPAMMGVLFQAKDTDLRAVSTDLQAAKAAYDEKGHCYSGQGTSHPRQVHRRRRYGNKRQRYACEVYVRSVVPCLPPHRRNVPDV